MGLTVVLLGRLAELRRVRAGATSDSFADFWEPGIHFELLCPSLIQVEVSSLTAIGYAIFGTSLADLLFSGEKWRMSAWGVEDR